MSAWAALYGGELVADDIEAVAEDLKDRTTWPLVFCCGLPAGLGTCSVTTRGSNGSCRRD